MINTVSMGASYQACPTKRSRRTKADISAIRDAVIEVITDDLSARHPRRDRENRRAIGPELIGCMQRAAADAVGPHLANLATSNEELRRRLAQEARHRLDQQVAEAVPNYLEIDRMPEWRKWLLGVDPLSGSIRQYVLNDAIAEANASRVVAFFRGFLAEHGRVGPAPAQRAPAARQPALVAGRTYTLANQRIAA